MSDAVYTSGEIEKELELHGCYAWRTEGVSMEPLFRHHRDVVVIGRLSGLAKKYDIVLYPNGKGGYILHRVIGDTEDCYIIRGDNCFGKERVPHGAVIGVLTEFTRAGKHHSCRDLSFRVYSRLWHWLYPVRYALHAIRGMLGRAWRALWGKKK